MPTFDKLLTLILIAIEKIGAFINESKRKYAEEKPHDNLVDGDVDKLLKSELSYEELAARTKVDIERSNRPTE